MWDVIDLRSDTLTQPTEEMKKFMFTAKLGDDVFGEDPTTNELQEYAADLLGKEAALFVTSGVMGNQLAIAVNTNPGDEVIVEKDSHIFYYETAAPSIISRVQLRPLTSDKGEIEENLIIESVRTSDYWYPKTTMICLENTHNRHGGTVLEPEYIHKVSGIAKNNNCSFHCDGARLWNASVYKGITPADYLKEFDTASVCLSKGLGAPVGSILAGPKDKIEKARKWRKILGGGMRQSGILAAAGLFALKHNINRVAEDHKNAKIFAEILSECPEIEIDLTRVVTNILYFKLNDRFDSVEFEAELKRNGLLIIATENNNFRAVFHLGVTESDTWKAGDIMKYVLFQFNKNN